MSLSNLSNQNISRNSPTGLKLTPKFSEACLAHWQYNIAAAACKTKFSSHKLHQVDHFHTCKSAHISDIILTTFSGVCSPRNQTFLVLPPKRSQSNDSLVAREWCTCPKSGYWPNKPYLLGL